MPVSAQPKCIPRGNGWYCEYEGMGIEGGERVSGKKYHGILLFRGSTVVLLYTSGLDY